MTLIKVFNKMKLKWSNRLKVKNNFRNLRIVKSVNIQLRKVLITILKLKGKYRVRWILYHSNKEIQINPLVKNRIFLDKKVLINE